MHHMKWFLALCVAMIAGAAQAQFAGQVASNPVGGTGIPNVNIYCADASNNAVPCSFGGGGGGGTVTQGPAGTAAWKMSDVQLDALITGGALPVSGTFWQSTQPVSGTFWQSTQPVSGTFWQTTQPVSGAIAQSGTWQVNLGYGGSLVSSGNPLGTKDIALDALITGGALPVSGTFWQSTQPVSGTFWQTTQPVSGAIAQSGTWQVNLGYGGSLVSSGNPLGTKDIALDALITGGALPVSGTFWQSTQPVSGTFWQTTQPVSVASLPLPTGASSSSVNQPGYLQAVSSGGATVASYVNAAASCMPTSVKTASGNVYSYSVSNSNATAVWFRIIASASAPTCGSGTIVRRVYIPPTATVGLDNAEGLLVGTGIAFDVTSGSGADTDATTVATANTVFVNIDYK